MKTVTDLNWEHLKRNKLFAPTGSVLNLELEYVEKKQLRGFNDVPAVSAVEIIPS